MRPLEAHRIAVVAAGGERAPHGRVAALQRAGASVRFCEVSQDFWSSLSEMTFDAVVVLVARADHAALALYDQLSSDPRTRGLPALLLTDVAGGATERAANVLSSGIDDATLVEALVDRITPVRRLQAAEASERALREQLRGEMLRAHAKARDLADLSHELRAMLDAVMGFACNLRDELPGPLVADQRSHVAGILDAVERASKLLDKTSEGAAETPLPLLLAPSSSPPRAQRTLVHLAQLAIEVSSLFEAVAARKSLHVECQCDETVCVWGDGLKLKQVVTNLVMNALKYTPRGGRVLVRVAWSKPSGGHGVQARRSAELIVIDTGPGIAPEHRERIFERGFRVDPRADVAGDGIGLAVVKDLVAQHGGSIAVDGEPGAGAIFKVSLPQDRRQRSRTGALVLCEGEAARALLEMLSVSPAGLSEAHDDESRGLMIELARKCEAAILLATHAELETALGRLRERAGSDQRKPNE
jgi:signal transduction histidine kinase